MTEHDKAIVVGAGHNGLTCAAYLAKAGYQVLVCEAADHVGGASETHEFADGFRVSGCSHYLNSLNESVARDLNLQGHGLKTASSNLATIALGVDGQHVTINADRLDGPVSDRDREGMAEFARLTRRFASLLSRYLNQKPPLLVKNSGRDRMTLARLGLDVRRLGRDDMREFLRIVAINIYDVLNEFFDHDGLKGALSLDSVLGTHLGPRSPNSVLTYLYRLANLGATGIGQAAGGMGSVTAALADSARAAGVEIRTGAVVDQIRVEGGRVVGVKLADGDVIDAPLVVSNADPKTTVLSLVGARHFETGFTRRIDNFRSYGNAAKSTLR